MRSLERPRSSDRGASSVEYALLIAFIAAIVVGGIILLGQAAPTLYEVGFPPG